MPNGKNKYFYYGGAFNPFHNGHKFVVYYLNRIIEEIDTFKKTIIHCDYEKKVNKEMIPWMNRYYIIKKSLKEYKNVEVINLLSVDNTVKLLLNESDGSTYQNIKCLEKTNFVQDNNAEIVIVIGMDQALNINNWKYYHKIIYEYNFFIFDRDNNEDLMESRAIKCHELFEEHNIIYPDRSKYFEIFSKKYKSTISSTEIRNNLNNGGINLEEYVNKNCIDDIKLLYRQKGV